MVRLINAVVFLIASTVHLHIATGYKWETVKAGVELPKNTIELGSSYVGRVVHYNLVLPARVINSSHAVAFNFNTKTKIHAEEFEILTYSEKEKCEWKHIRVLTDVPENVVRVGRAWNREPIYLGAVGYDEYSVYKEDIASILLTSVDFFSETNAARFALFCDDNPSWIDATYPNIPSNTVFLRDNSIVARLVGPYSLIPAIYNIEAKSCSSFFDRIEIESVTCQVLTTNSSEYRWERPGSFERIPGNAVAQGRTRNNELVYFKRDDFKSFAPFTFSTVANTKYIYEVLVKNEA